MATKQEIIDKTKTVYTENPDITDWVEVEETLHTDPASIIENFYGAKTDDTEATTNVLTAVSADIIYNAKIIKQGGRVSIQGSFRNTSGAIINTATVLFEITNTEYQQQSGTSFTDIGTSIFTNEIVMLNLSTNDMINLDAIGIGEVVNFNIEYNTDA